MRGNNRAEVTVRRSKKTTQILLIIAGLFGIHWLPFHILTIGIVFLNLLESISEEGLIPGKIYKR